MSMMVVWDVTESRNSSASVAKKTNKVRSEITPFQKILDREETKKAADAPDVSAGSGTDSGNVGKVSSSSPADGAEESASSGGTTLKSLFKKASEKYDISYDFLVAVAKAESDFNTKCVSSAGAKGIMQIMPDECRELGVTDPFDAKQNIMASARLLKAHLEKFDGDFTLAAAAYNAGSGAVKKYGGVPPYKETQNYVKKIKKYMQEGVTVPDRTVSVEEENSGGGGSAGKDVNKTKAAEESFDTGKAASDSDWEQVMVAVGTGDNKVTMSYGAYLRYLELGTTGVG